VQIAVRGYPHCEHDLLYILKFKIFIMTFDDIIKTTRDIEKKAYSNIKKTPLFKIQRRCTKRLYLVCRNGGKSCNFSIRCRKTSAGNVKIIESNYKHSCFPTTCDTIVKVNNNCPPFTADDTSFTDGDNPSSHNSANTGSKKTIMEVFPVESFNSNCQPSSQDFVWQTDDPTFTDGDNSLRHISANIGNIGSNNVARVDLSPLPETIMETNVETFPVQANNSNCPFSTQDFVWHSDDPTFTDGDNSLSHISANIGNIGNICSNNVGLVDLSPLPENKAEAFPVEANNSNRSPSNAETSFTNAHTFTEDYSSDKDDILSNESTGSLKDLLSLVTPADIHSCKKRTALQKYVNIIISVLDSTGNHEQHLSSILNDILLKEFGIPFVLDLFRVSTLTERDNLIIDLQMLRSVLTPVPLGNFCSSIQCNRYKEPLYNERFGEYSNSDNEDVVTYFD